jgi:glycosyltransferase involved in cell wall biosynthesis
MINSRKLRKALSVLTLPLNNQRFDQLVACLKGVITREFVVFISHADYLVSGGGTEKYQAADLAAINAYGYDVVQIYPVPYNKLKLYGVNWNHRPLARGVTSKQLSRLVSTLKSSERLFSFNIHHLLGWDYSLIHWFLNEISDSRVIVYLHDFYMLCPSKHLSRNDKHYCGYLESSDEVAICSGCHYKDQLREWRNLFSRVFDMVEHIVCPSDIVADVFKQTYKIDQRKINVCGYLKLVTIDRLPYKTATGKLRVAYLGASKDHKGWRIFRRVFRDPVLRRSYDFYHIGSSINIKTLHLHRVAYSFHKNQQAAVEALIRHEIDIVLLLSIVPETYSFTLHESYAACIPELTLEQSGNIARKINNGQVYGRVLSSGDSLLAFMGELCSVNAFVAGKPQR